MEMIKGIQGHGYYDELVVPIIENTAHERELTESLTEAVRFLHSLSSKCLNVSVCTRVHMDACRREDLIFF